jgi:type VI secretion system protein ImpI
MTLTLHIENETSLPDGGPLSVSIKGKRGLDIGRDPYLDWTLPDPSRSISGRHCEVRWHDSAYWLHDISTNGTFLHGAESRLKAPHRLRNGDRFVIGQYIIAAALEEEIVEPGEGAPVHVPPRDDDLWDAGPDAADPIDPQQLKGPRDASPVRPDFLDWAVDVPTPTMHRAPPAATSVSSVQVPSVQVSSVQISSVRAKPLAIVPEHASWAEGPPPPLAAPPEIIPVPTPRRPETGEPKRPWPVAELEPAAMEERNVDFDAMAKFAELVARGAGLPENAFAGRDPGELAEQFGRLLKLATDNMKQLLEARQHAKRLARSPNQTAVQAINNNPLKFAPSPEDALRIMFGSPGRSYLDAERAFAQGFDDLKKHQIKTYSAMQRAVTLLMKDVDPAAVEAASQSDRGLAGMMGSRKARLWDLYVARWQAHARRHDNGILDTFMDYFARCYDGE